MKLTNNQIYSYAEQLSALNVSNIKMPVRIGFFLQKNIQTIISASQEIEWARMNIAREFGELSEDGTQFIVPPAKMPEAQKELNDLFNLEQDLNIHIFKLKDFDGIELTYQQLSSIIFMIADPEEEEEY